LDYQHPPKNATSPILMQQGMIVKDFEGLGGTGADGGVV
jgi:hypothetical protein